MIFFLCLLFYLFLFFLFFLLLGGQAYALNPIVFVRIFFFFFFFFSDKTDQAEQTIGPTDMKIGQ